jgi:hypothetical protein
MRIILAAVPLVLLAACGGTAQNKAGNAANAANAAAPAPAANAAAPADPRRANEIQECIADVRTELPEGADLNGFCGCAVDKMQTGARERDAMEQCAAEMHIQPRGR